VIYKNNFVALYNQDDVCVLIADTWKELADFLGKDIKNVQSSLSHIFHKRENAKECRNLLHNGEKLTPYLFSMDENEEE
jgi:hypothetical protein